MNLIVLVLVWTSFGHLIDDGLILRESVITSEMKAEFQSDCEYNYSFIYELANCPFDWATEVYYGCQKGPSQPINGGNFSSSPICLYQYKVIVYSNKIEVRFKSFSLCL